MRKDNLTGKKYGMLTVLQEGERHISSSGNSYLRWLCKCECGKERLVTPTGLKSGIIWSCGCSNFSKPHGNRKTTAQDASFNALWNRNIQAAKRRNHQWSLTKKQFKNLIYSRCHYCNTNPSTSYNVYATKNGTYRAGCNKEWADKATLFYNGIDRKDNNKGYIDGNVLTCCFICNRAKLTMSYNDFIKWIEKIKNNYENLLH